MKNSVVTEQAALHNHQETAKIAGLRSRGWRVYGAGVMYDGEGRCRVEEHSERVEGRGIL